MEGYGGPRPLSIAVCEGWAAAVHAVEGEGHV